MRINMNRFAQSMAEEKVIIHIPLDELGDVDCLISQKMSNKCSLFHRIYVILFRCLFDFVPHNSSCSSLINDIPNFLRRTQNTVLLNGSNRILYLRSMGQPQLVQFTEMTEVTTSSEHNPNSIVVSNWIDSDSTLINPQLWTQIPSSWMTHNRCHRWWYFFWFPFRW